MQKKDKGIPKHALEFLEIIKEKSAILCAEFAGKCGFKNYGVTRISHSTFQDLCEGEYFYDFDENDNLRLISLPLSNYSLRTMLYNSKTAKYEPVYSQMVIFDSSKAEFNKIIQLSQDMIYDFDLDGTQVSLTQSTQNGSTPIVKTMFSEFLFGSSYAIINGLSSNMPRIDSKIEDLRTIQIVLNDHSDFRLQGISIYYDLKRYFGNVKNKKVNLDPVLETKITQNSKNSSDKFKENVEQLKSLKELLDLGIINQIEFDMKKKELLGL